MVAVNVMISLIIVGIGVYGMMKSKKMEDENELLWEMYEEEKERNSKLHKENFQLKLERVESEDQG